MNKLEMIKILAVTTLLMICINLVIGFVAVSKEEEALYYLNEYNYAEYDSIYESEMYDKYIEKLNEYEMVILIIGFCSLATLVLMIVTTIAILTMKEKEFKNNINYTPQVKETKVTICWNCKNKFYYVPNPYGVKQVTCPTCNKIGIIPKES